MSAYSVGSYQFQSRNTFPVYSGSGADRYSVDYLIAMPTLPTGGRVEKIELHGCDNSSTDEVSLTIGTCPTPGENCEAVTGSSVSTGIAGIPGCGVFPLTLGSSFQVDSNAPVYLTISTGSTSATTFSFVKIYYRLQVSPAPLTATFADVPASHPYFRAIEALAAAGITSGCGGGNFCPGSNVTRGELAKFLANALGLHFPN